MKYFVKINLQKIIKIMVTVIRPIFNFVYRRKAKQKFTVPIPIQWYKQYKIALKWIYWTMYNPSYKSLEIQLIKESCRIILRKRNLLLKRRRAFYHNVANNRFFLRYRWK